MTARIIDGKATADAILNEVRGRVLELNASGTEPTLAAVLVGDDPASMAYVKNKRRACDSVGIRSVLHRLPGDMSQSALLELITELNSDQSVHGILVQLPLPEQINSHRVIEEINPVKDVDGFHPVNIGRLVIGLDSFSSCTPAGIIELLLRADVRIEGQHVVVLGRSNIVGKPMMNLLVQKGRGANATVTVCHSGTRDLATFSRQADILIAAVGRPGFVTADMVKPGAVVIDVGINRVDDASARRGYRLVGDVDFDAVKDVAAAISPVPGGVGPMTVAMLMWNTAKAAQYATAEENSRLY
ncbi:MAG: bifunctional methylenetetrahydrofolate dehydrogenase/methenyltetrahydrofolate cyclohydrolase FolD [Pseudomonadota bacterium]|nr:bifunctional methylenetetrahydrofolate dehydrogenase/methenyltetrahydrofolate cyclohydrolase FolD [Pseudomonadota bacterium]